MPRPHRFTSVTRHRSRVLALLVLGLGGVDLACGERIDDVTSSLTLTFLGAPADTATDLSTGTSHTATLTTARLRFSEASVTFCDDERVVRRPLRLIPHAHAAHSTDDPTHQSAPVWIDLLDAETHDLLVFDLPAGDLCGVSLGFYADDADDQSPGMELAYTLDDGTPYTQSSRAAVELVMEKRVAFDAARVIQVHVAPDVLLRDVIPEADSPLGLATRMFNALSAAYVPLDG